MGNSYYVWFTQATTDLLTRHSAVFNGMGWNLFKGFAVILIVWYGVTTALGAVSGGVVRWDKFAGLLMSIAFTYAMLSYYNRPLPGIGISFHNLITDEGASLASQIEVATNEDVSKQLETIYDSMEQPSGPGIFDVLEVIRYIVIVILISFAQAAILAVISFGFVAVGVCVLVGPLFIPFFIVPHLEWMFWGWLKTFIQYAFYPVIGNAFVYVYGQLILHFSQQYAPPYDISTIAGLIMQLALLLIAFTFGVLKVPALVSSIFSGRSGDHAFPGIGWWR